MRHAIAAALTLAIVAGAGCSDRSSADRAAVDLLKRENEALTTRLKAVEDELADARKRASRSEEFSQQIFERLKRVEGVLGERLYGAPTVSPAQQNLIDTLQNVRGAMVASTTAPSTSTTPPARSATTPVPPQPRVATPPPPAGPSPAEFMDANRFIDALDKIKTYCARKWATDASMQAYCIGKQSIAANRLDNRGKPFGMDRAKYERTRVDCFKRWGVDYNMRLYCEEKEFGE